MYRLDITTHICNWFSSASPFSNGQKLGHCPSSQSNLGGGTCPYCTPPQLPAPLCYR